MFVTVILLCVIAGLIAGAYFTECRLCREEREAAGSEVPTDTTAV